MTIAYRGEGSKPEPGCTLMAHYLQLQCVADALGFAAQTIMAEELVQQVKLSKAAALLLTDAYPQNLDNKLFSEAVKIADHHAKKAEYWYGIYQGYRGILRAIEGNIGELEQIERDMLDRINWEHDPPFFRIPGMEHFQGKPQHLPGEGESEA